MRRLHCEAPTENDVLRAYLNKNAAYNKVDMRRIKRSLRKLGHVIRSV